MVALREPPEAWISPDELRGAACKLSTSFRKDVSFGWDCSCKLSGAQNTSTDEA